MPRASRLGLRRGEIADRETNREDRRAEARDELRRDADPERLEQLDLALAHADHRALRGQRRHPIFTHQLGAEEPLPGLHRSVPVVGRENHPVDSHFMILAQFMISRCRRTAARQHESGGFELAEGGAA